MKKLTKTIICLALCLVCVIGSSLTSFAWGGSYKVGNHNIACQTRKTNIYMVASQCSDAYYKFSGTACYIKISTGSKESYPVSGGNGIWRASSCEVNQGVASGYCYADNTASFNRVSFMRSTNLGSGFTSLYAINYKIGYTYVK